MEIVLRQNSSVSKFYSQLQVLFKDIPQSLVTTFVMMMGEMNYGVIFLDSGPLYHPNMMYPLYIIFCFCMPIIFLNFLVSVYCSGEV